MLYYFEARVLTAALKNYPDHLNVTAPSLLSPVCIPLITGLKWKKDRHKLEHSGELSRKWAICHLNTMGLNIAA